MRSSVHFRLAASALLGGILAGCSGGGSSTATPPIRTPEAEFVFTIPLVASGTSLRRRAFVSSATKSAKIVVHGATSVIVTEVVALTPSAPGCTENAQATVCTETVALQPGSFDANITTYDDTAGQGRVLGAVMTVPFTVTSPGANVVPIDVDGVPARITVMPVGATTATGSQSSGFVLFGATPLSLSVEAVDADGAIIAGAGSPTFTASVVTASAEKAYSIVQPTPAAPNVFDLKPPGVTGSTTTVSIVANYPDASVCSETAAVCTTTFAAKNDAQTLFILDDNTNTIVAYPAPYTGATTTLPPIKAPPGTGLALGAATSDGDLFVGVTISEYPFPGYVARYVKPYTEPPATITGGGLQFPQAMAVSANGDLLVANATHGLLAFAPPYTAPGVGVTTFPFVAAVAAAANGNIFITNPYITSNGDPDGYELPGSDTLQEIAPPFGGTSPLFSIPDGEGSSSGQVLNSAGSLTLGASGNLFVGYPDKIVVLAPPYTGKPIATMVIPTPIDEYATSIAPALDASGDVFEPVPGGVGMFAPPYKSAPKIVAPGVSSEEQSPSSILVDNLGNLIVVTDPSYVGEQPPAVLLYAPPYTGTPKTIYQAKEPLPLGVALTP